MFFRAYTQKAAQKLGIRGWVTNLSDGRVQCMALGDPETMDLFLRELQKGPPSSRVDGLLVEELAETQDFTEFEIHH